jgi:hypothetical protein
MSSAKIEQCSGSRRPRRWPSFRAPVPPAHLAVVSISSNPEPPSGRRFGFYPEDGIREGRYGHKSPEHPCQGQPVTALTAKNRGHWRLLSWRYEPIAGSPQRCSPETLIGFGAGVLDDDLGVSREMLRHRTVLAEKILMLASGLL